MRKMTSILLAAVMLLCLLPAGKARPESSVLDAQYVGDFTDAAQIEHVNAVAVTVGLGLFAGTADGRFDPKGTVTRAQIATLIVKLLMGSELNADAYKGVGRFSDTAAFEGGWAEGYINACAQMGVVSGYPDGTFQPGNAVNTAEALTMLVNALGNRPASGSWPDNYTGKAAEMGLYGELDPKPGDYDVLDRDRLAVLLCEGACWSGDGNENHYRAGATGTWYPTLAEAMAANAGSSADVTRVPGSDSLAFKAGVSSISYGPGTAKPTPGGPLTRADLEKAIAETAFAYYLKGGEYEYCNGSLGVMGRSYDGQTKLSHLTVPEDVTADTHRFGVCTAYVFHVYWAALGHRLFGLDNENEFLTDRFWRIIENQADTPYKGDGLDPVTDKDVDQCVLRWKSSDYEFDSIDRHFGVDKSPYFANFGDTHLDFANGYYADSPAEQEMADNAVQAFINDWQHNLRPGDIFLLDGHAMLYIGNDCVLDCGSPGGGVYNTTTGFEPVEPVGSVWKFHSVEFYYTNKNGYGYWIDEESSKKRVAIVRPLNALCVSDGDVDPGNDAVKDPSFTIPSASLGRQTYPGIEIDRSVDVGPYGTVPAGGTLTYSIKISNKSNEKNYAAFRGAAGTAYQGLEVTELIPAGTEFVAASDGASPAGGKLTWKIDVPAGSTKDLTFTVRVTAPMGQRIVCSDGKVGGIPSNTISTAVGGAALGEKQLKALAEIADTDPADWLKKFDVSGETHDLDFVERIYQKMGIALDLPTVAEYVGQQFVYDNVAIPSTDFAVEGSTKVDVFMLRDPVDAAAKTGRDMLVDRYVGGFRFYSGKGNLGTNVNYFDPDQLSPGDVLVYVPAASSSGVPTSTTVMVSARTSDGQPALLAVTSKGQTERFVGRDEVYLKLWQAFRKAHRLFFLMRPTQAIPDVNAQTFSGPEPKYSGVSATQFKPLKLGTTTLTASQEKQLKNLDYAAVTGTKVDYLVNAYKQIGIKGLDAAWINHAGTKQATGLSTMNVFFIRTDDHSVELDRTYYSKEKQASNLSCMWIPGFAGGSWVVDGSRPEELSMSMLKPGDVIFLGDRTADSAGTEGTSELCAIYQGDGKFLVGGSYWTTIETSKHGRVSVGNKYGRIDFSGAAPTGEFSVDGTETAVGHTYRTVNDLKGGDASNGYIKVDSFTDFLTNDPFTGEPWDFFFAMRPSQGMYDVQDPAYVPNW